MFRSFSELCRISNLPTVWTNVTAAWVLAGGRVAWDFRLLWLLIGASLVYSAGMILNDTCDVAWDREKRPERPIPSGRIELGTAWAAGLAGLLGGYALMVFAGGAAGGITALLVAAIVLYDVYHKPWAGSVVVMGACRTLLYLSTASAFIQGSCKSDAAWFVLAVSGLVLGIYVVALSLIARAEAKGGTGPGMRLFMRVLLLLPVPWSLWLEIKSGQLYPPFGLVFETIVILGFLIWVTLALRAMKRGGPAVGDAVGLLLAGIPLVDALNFVPFYPLWAFGFCFLSPVLRYWQRWVAAT